jgi:hypothetical protein
VIETWRQDSAPTHGLFHTQNDLHVVAVAAVKGSADGRALELRLAARPASGPPQGVSVKSNRTYRYGTFGTRMKSADCTGQDHVGVVTGTFTYSFDHSDANGNGLQDNDEIDIEFHCGQTKVIYLTIWTDYDEATDTPHKITRAIDLSTGRVLLNCYVENWSGPCLPRQRGENFPASVTPIPNYDSTSRFRSYRFDWRPDRVTFYASADNGRRILLWDYRGPTTRIPQKPGNFIQNVWHTASWDPFNGPSHNQPTDAVSAYIDSSTVPNVG